MTDKDETTAVRERRRYRQSDRVKPKIWQDDQPFCDWLVEVKNYAALECKGTKTTVRPRVSLGVVLYMWEAWCAGKDLG